MRRKITVVALVLGAVLGGTAAAAAGTGGTAAVSHSTPQVFYHS
jgi:hypothetical protein